MKRMNRVCACVTGTLLLGATARAQTPYFVNDDAPGPVHDGTTWANAAKFLRDALADAPGVIWVAAGTYRPDESALWPNGTDDRSATFQLINGKQVYGGFLGNEDPATFDLDDRQVDANLTILSGEIGGGSISDNSYHVVMGNGTTWCTGTNPNVCAELNGFTVSGGNANSPTTINDREGGGMHNFKGSPTVRWCTFSNNRAEFGAGMMNERSSPHVSDCTFKLNLAEINGGGMHSFKGSAPILTDCRFEDNQAERAGGGANFEGGLGLIITRCDFIRNKANTNSIEAGGGGAFLGSGSGAVLLIDCTFRLNTAKRGGALYADHPTLAATLCEFVDNRAVPDIDTGYGGAAWIATYADINGPPANDVYFNNCLFGRNTAKTDGGAVYFGEFSGFEFATSPELRNCTFTENIAQDGNGGGIYFTVDTPKVFNAILWCNDDIDGTDETSQIHSDGTGSAAATYTDWQGHTGGIGNVNVKPRFVDPTGDNEFAVDDFFIAAGSPCIDAGKNGDIPAGVTLDLIDTDRTIDDPLILDTGAAGWPDADLGAYEFFPDCDGNGIRDDCDVACGVVPGQDCWGVPGCGLGDLDFDGVPDACECVDADACGDTDANGITDDNCKWFDCGDPVTDACYSEARIFADAGGAFGACPLDGFCNIHDMNHALACFAGSSLCDDINMDLGGAFGACPPDGFCNIHDRNHAATCFAGSNPCTCSPCPGGIAGAMQGPGFGGATGLEAIPVPALSSPNARRVRIYTTAALADIQGYQLDVVVSGGTSGQLELLDITIEPRADFVFAGRTDTYEAFNLTNGQMLCGVDGDGEGVATTGPVYLATYTYRVPMTAAGDFVLDIRRDEAAGDQTFLIASGNGRIEVSATTPGIISAAPVAVP